MIYRLNIFFLSLFIAFAPAYAFASVSSAGISPWSITNAISQGAKRVYDLSKTVGGAVTVSTAEVLPTAAQVGKQIIKTGGAAAVVYAITAILGEGVDYVLDPENSLVRYYTQDTCQEDSCRYYWSYYKSGEGTKTDATSPDDACLRQISSYHNNWSYSGMQLINNGMNAKCFMRNTDNVDQVTRTDIVIPPGTSEKTIPYETVGAQIISDAEANNANAKAYTADVADDLVSDDSATQNNVKAQADANAKPADTSCTAPLKLNSTTHKCEPDTTNPTNPDTPKTPELPAFCSWVPAAICNWYYDTQPRITNIETATKDTKKTSDDILTESKKQTAEAVKTNTAIDEFTKNENNNNDQDNNIDFPSIPLPTNTQVVFDHSCPAPVTLAGFSYHGITQNWVVDFSSMCDVLTSIVRPVVIAVGSFISIGIIAGIRENG